MGHKTANSNTNICNSTKRTKASTLYRTSLSTDTVSVNGIHGALNGKSVSQINKPELASTDSEWIDTVQGCPVYYPTKQEFEDPFLYLRSIAPEASKYGICKIVPPLSSSVPAGIALKKETKDFKFTTKVQPLKLPQKNSKNNYYMRGRHYTVRDFEKMANTTFARKYALSGCLPSKYVEKEFWREMARGKKGTVEYGADLDATAFSRNPHDQLGQSKWNLKTLPCLPSSVLRLLDAGIPGVTDPMLYIGMLFSMFAWHVEDHYLYSMSYLHCGAPKIWYGVPSHKADDFEKVVQCHVYDDDIVSSDGKKGALRVFWERTTMFPSSVLMQHGVPVYKAVQLPGEFVINFPRSYHSGFNQGFNCSEAVNFAIGDWFPFGAEATKRYAVLSKTPVVPYEELLCKEAMLLSRSSMKGDNFHGDSISAENVKITFAPLIRVYQCARWGLKKLGASVRVFPDSEDMIFCSLCNRECYVAHFMCKCHRKLLCLFHEIESYNCLHQGKCTLFIRRDMLEMESVAKKFEQEECIREVIQERMRHENVVWMQNVFSGVVDERGPYGEDADYKLGLEIKDVLRSLEKCCKKKRSRSRRQMQNNGQKKASKLASYAF